MNGCQYDRPQFSLPAAPSHVTDIRWDFAFLSVEDFVDKYSEQLYVQMSEQK